MDGGDGYLSGSEEYNAENISTKWHLLIRKCKFHIKIESMAKRSDATAGAIWRQIAATVKNYVQRTDVRRSHLAELRRLDAESAAEIATNQERIKAQEEEIEMLQGEYENLVKVRQDQTEAIAVRIQILTQEFNDARKLFRREVYLDEKQLFFMTTISNKTIEHLDKLANKGDRILTLAKTCRKYETEREKVAKWLPVLEFADNDGEKEEKSVEEKTDTKPRPKTGRPPPPKKSETLSTASDVDVEEMVKSIIISAKSSVSSSSSSSSSPSGSKRLSRFDHLNDLENFWIAFNKAEVDCKAIREEKKLLLEQNKQYRGMMRAVLEAAVLAQNSAPTSKISTRAASKRRSAVSAPLRRIIM